MNDCPLKPYCDANCDNCTDTDKAEKIDHCAQSIQRIAENIMEVMMPAIQEATKTITGLLKSVVEGYPNRRVAHLALHHPKKKVRKKNTNRIMRQTKAEGKSLFRA